MDRRGRVPGSLCRFKCCTCGAVELVTGGSNQFRCSDCRRSGIYPNGRPRWWSWIGKEAAGAQVSKAIRAGSLPHPRTRACADCGGPAIEYEHRDYNEPLKVEPICRGCNLRRGPAIPLRGAIDRLLAWGYVPYSSRHRTEQLFRALGRHTGTLAGLPARLTLDNWRAIWPELAAPSEPATEPATASEAS